MNKWVVYDLKNDWVPINHNAVVTEQDCKDVQTLLLTTLKSFLVNPINDWVLSSRAMNILKRCGWRSLYALRELDVRDIVRQQNLGQSTISEITKEALRNGYKLENWEAAYNKLRQGIAKSDI